MRIQNRIRFEGSGRRTCRRAFAHGQGRNWTAKLRSLKHTGYGHLQFAGRPWAQLGCPHAGQGYGHLQFAGRPWEPALQQLLVTRYGHLQFAGRSWVSKKIAAVVLWYGHLQFAGRPWVKLRDCARGVRYGHLQFAGRSWVADRGILRASHGICAISSSSLYLETLKLRASHGWVCLAGYEGTGRVGHRGNEDQRWLPRLA